MSPPGWWRRNRWGLVALVPVLALAIGLRLGPVYEDFWQGRPREAVTPGADGWMRFGPSRLRLVGFGPATDLQGVDGRPFVPPRGIKAWRAEIAFEAPDQDGVGGCQTRLQDHLGRRYGTGAAELQGARNTLATCAAGADQPASAYRSVFYFATPASARPVAVRIELRPQLPRYAWLAIPAAG